MTIYRGSGFREQMFAYGPNNVPDNFAGYGAEVCFLNKDKTVALKLTAAEGGVDFVGAPGAIAIVMTEAQTLSMPEGAGDYYLNLLPPVGPSIRFLVGRAVFV